MIDRATVDRIYAAANIVEVVGDFVTLRKKGVNYQACCPFHDEKTPSFVVSPSKGVFKCFGCGKGGNAVSFVMEHENLDYASALKWVAKKYNIEVKEKELSPDEQRVNDDRESMMILSSFAADYFRNTLNTDQEGRAVGLAYFRERGFSEATIEKFGLGYCLAAGGKFSETALASGYREEFLISTGLSIKRDNGTLYDRFSGRVIFPIHSISGRVTAFGGRTMRTDKKVAKYLNSPESDIYHKSNILYGLYFSKKEITRADCCILVEGYTDVISMHQSGVENVVASSGTSLTEEQVKLIARFTKNVTVIYDGDSAGIKASLRGIDMILKEGMNVRVVLLPEGEDPDSFARAHSASELKEYIASREEDFISFKIRLLMADAKNDPIKRAALISDIVESISVIPDDISRNVYLKECSLLMNIDESVIRSEVAKKRRNVQLSKDEREFFDRRTAQEREERGGDAGLPVIKNAGVFGSSIDELEREIVTYLLRYGCKVVEFSHFGDKQTMGVARAIISDIEEDKIEFSNPLFKTIYLEYKSLYEENREYSQEEFPIARLLANPDPAISGAVTDIMMGDDGHIPSKLWIMSEIAVETEEQRLYEAVPRALILYKAKVIDGMVRTLAELLPKGGEFTEEDMEVLMRINNLNAARNEISKKYSRIIL